MTGNLRLVIVDGLSFVADQTKRGELIRALQKVEHAMVCAVLAVVDEVPTEAISDGSAINEVADGRLTLAKPEAGAEGWARAFTLERIGLLGSEAVAVRPGAAVAFRLRWKAPEPVKAAASTPKPEPKIARKIDVAMTGQRIGEAERARWPEQGRVVYT